MWLNEVSKSSKKAFSSFIKTCQAEAESLCTAEYVIELHVIGHIKAPQPQQAKDR